MTIGRRRKSKILNIISYLLLILITIFVVFPILWLIITSLKTYPEIYKYPITYYPHHVTWEHFEKISGMNFWQYFFNSIIISTGTMLISLIIGIFPAYAFAQYKFKGKTPLLLSVMLFQMFPMVVFLNSESEIKDTILLVIWHFHKSFGAYLKARIFVISLATFSSSSRMWGSRLLE